MPQSDPLQFKSAKLFKGYKPIICIKLISYAANDTYRFGSITVTPAGDSAHTHIIKSLPTISRSLKLMGGMSSIGSISFSILNQEKYSDFLRTGGGDPQSTDGLGLTMGTALISLLFNDGTTVTWAERLDLFTGIMDDFSFDYNRINFSIIDNDKSKNKTIGRLIVSSDYPTTLQENYGKTINTIYGEHQFKINANINNGITATNWTPSRENNVVPIPLIDIGNDHYLISNLKIKEFNSSSGDTIWAYDPNIGRMVELKDWTLISNNDVEGCVISRDDNNFYDYRLPILAAGGDWTNFRNIWFGSDVTTSTTTSIAAGDPLFTTKDLTVTFPTNEIDLALVDEVKIFLLGDWTTADAPDVYELDLDGGAGAIVWPTNDDTTDFIAHDGNAGDARIESITISYEKTTEGVGGAGGSATLYQCYMRVRYENTDKLQLYFGGQYGQEYDTWINGRSTGETDPNTGENYTVNHPDDDGADLKMDVNNDGSVVANGNQLTSTLGMFTLLGIAAGDTLYIEESGSNQGRYEIESKDDFNHITVVGTFAATQANIDYKIHTPTIIENFVGAIESGARDLLSLGNSDLEVNSFNVAADARSANVDIDWKFSFAMTKQTNAIKLLSQMAFECGCWLFWNYANRLEILAYDSSPDFSVGGGAMAISDDIFIHQPEIHAIDFDNAANAKITFTGHADHRITGDLTIEAWVYFDNFTTQEIISCGAVGENAADNYLFEVYFTAADTVVCFHEHGAGNNETVTVTLDASLSIATWYHISIRRDIAPIKIYYVYVYDIEANLIAFGLTEYTNNPTDGGNAFLTIGNNADLNKVMEGKIKEVRLWNVKRSLTELTDNLWKILIGNETNLVGYWRLDEGALTTVDDITANDHDGTMGAGCTWVTGTTFPDLGYYAQHPIVKDSFSIRLVNTADLVNDLTLNYYKNYQSGNYQKTSNTSIAASKAKYGTLTETKNIDFIKDTTTADALRDDLLIRKKEKYYIATFKTWLNASNSLEGDICSIRHPLLDSGIFTNANMKALKWQIISIKHLLSSCEIEIKAISLTIP